MDDKKKALEQVLSQIEKQYGKGAIMRLGEDAREMTVDVIPTGCLALDIALGAGGVPRGRIIEIYGPESSGKTTVTLHIIAETQKAGGIAAFIDAEHALDPAYAANLGVDLDNLYVSQPDTGEQALDITDSLVRSGAVDLIVIDSVAADIALGAGGVPRGRIIEIYGPESSGKTTVTLHIIAETQKAGGIAAFIDAEHALDPAYAANLGVDLDNLYVSQPDTGEQALDITDSLVRSGAVDLIVIDSVAALTPKAEIEGDMGDQHVGLQARLMSQALRKLTAITNKSKTCVVFINQLREKVGVMFGNPETTPGGKALKFYSSVRLDIRKADALKDSEGVYGNRTKVKVVKNKLAPPFKTAEFDMIYGKGISKEGCLLDIGVDKGVIEKSGSWFSYNGEKFAQGREKAKDYIAANAEFAAEIEGKIRDICFKPAEKSEEPAAE